MNIKIDLTVEEYGLIRLALTAWAFRSDREASEMANLAMGLHSGDPLRAKCEANTKASQKFAADSRQLLSKLTANAGPT